MNILIFSWRGPKHPNAGGAEISTHEHAKGWVRAGNQVTLFTSSFEGAKDHEVIDGVTIIRSGRQLIGVQIEALWWYLFKKHERFDIVVDQFHGIPFFSPLYVRCKIVVFIHEVTKEVWKHNQLPFPLNNLIGFIGYYFEPFVFKLFYRGVSFFTVSESTRDDLVKYGVSDSRIKVVKNGVNRPTHLPRTGKERINTVVYLGAFAKDKGIEDALQTFAQLKKQGGDWQFWLMGKSDKTYLEHLRSLACDLGLGDETKFLGAVSEKQKFDYLARAHLLLNPSVREGWGLVVIEAALVGTPSVGYNVAGLKDSILNGRTGVLCEPNPVAASDAISSLLSEGKRNEYQTMSKEARNYAKEFDWDKSSNDSLKFLRSIER